MWQLNKFKHNCLAGSGSLLAKSCQGALKLANHPEELQRLGYLFGRNLALAWQAYFDLEIFQEQVHGPFSLISGTGLKQKTFNKYKKTNYSSYNVSFARGSRFLFRTFERL